MEKMVYRLRVTWFRTGKQHVWSVLWIVSHDKYCVSMIQMPINIFRIRYLVWQNVPFNAVEKWLNEKLVDNSLIDGVGEFNNFEVRVIVIYRRFVSNFSQCRWTIYVKYHIIYPFDLINNSQAEKYGVIF